MASDLSPKIARAFDPEIEIAATDLAGCAAPVGDHRSGRLGHVNFDMEARGGQHVHQGVETEQLDLAPHEVGYARLRDANTLAARLWLRPSLAM